MTKSIQSSLSIKAFTLWLYLGVSQSERAHLQAITVEIDIFFKEAPQACETDRLSDTSCYASLITEINQYFKNKKTKLIEKVAQRIYTLCKTRLPIETNIFVHITKRPSIVGFSGQVRFSYGDQS